MSASVQLQKMSTTDSKMELTASQSDIGYSRKTCTSLVKFLVFLVVLVVLVAVAACVALAIIVAKQGKNPPPPTCTPPPPPTCTLPPPPTCTPPPSPTCTLPPPPTCTPPPPPTCTPPPPPTCALPPPPTCTPPPPPSCTPPPPPTCTPPPPPTCTLPPPPTCTPPPPPSCTPPPPPICTPPPPPTCTLPPPPTCTLPPPPTCTPPPPPTCTPPPPPTCTLPPPPTCTPPPPRTCTLPPPPTCTPPPPPTCTPPPPPTCTPPPPPTCTPPPPPTCALPPPPTCTPPPPPSCTPPPPPTCTPPPPRTCTLPPPPTYAPPPPPTCTPPPPPTCTLPHRCGKDGQRPANDGSSKSPSTTGSHSEDNSACLSPDCVVTAARVYENLDTTVSPCDDFYEFACGVWVKKHPIPEERSSVSIFSVLDEKLKVLLKALLEAPSGSDELGAVTKAKTLYKSCVDEEVIESRGLDPMQKVYATFGKWPLLNNTWDATQFDLIDSMVALRKYGTSPVILQTVTTDLKNSNVRKIKLDQPSLLMPGRDYYLSNANDSIPAIKKYITDLARGLGAQDMNQVERDVNDMVEFETSVARISAPLAERRDSNKLYNLMTIGDLYTNITDKFDWLRLIGGMMNITGVEIAITREEPVVVYNPQYLKQMVELIGRTPPRVLSNYLLTSTITGLVSTLPKHIRDISLEYDKVIYGTTTAPPRWKECVSMTNNRLGNAVGRLFVDEAFDDRAEATASEMISNIREAFNNLLAEQDWMDDATRAVAKEKADAVKEKIGYDQKAVRNDSYLNEKTKDLNFDPETYLENVLMSRRVYTVEALKKLREPVDKSEWLAAPAVVNAFYSSTRNAITFPAGILQPPFFSKHYPKAMNFGAIGVVIGHELTHGFDDRGRLFDKSGDLKTWWSGTVSSNFKAKAQCVVDQYAGYTFAEANMQLNGVNTQGENIADNGGLRQAYQAYRQWVAKQGKEEQKLPGLDFTPNQLFFLNFAQIWCNSMRPQRVVQQILTGVHSPGKYRVIGVLQNSEEFAEAFNCPKSSHMNPEKKCRVW